MNRSLENVTDNAFRAAFVLFALFAPFSIAGMNFALGLAALAWTLYIIDRRGARVRLDGVAAASIALALFALPSAFMSHDIPRALNDWRSYWELAILFLVGAHIARVRARTVTFWTLAFAGACASLVALVQSAGGLNAGPLHIAGAPRAGGTMFPSTFAGVLYQLILFTAALAVSPKMAGRRALLAAVVALEFAALLFTRAPGAWAALMAGALVLCLILRDRALAAGAGIALAAILAFSLAPFPQPDARGADTQPPPWRVSWELFTEHPVFGVGTGNLSIAARRHLGARAGTGNMDTHNVFLHLLATRGLVGFLPFVLYFAVLLRSLARIHARAGPMSVERHYTAGAMAVVTAILAGGLGENNMGDSEVFMLLMFLTAMARSSLGRESPRAG